MLEADIAASEELTRDALRAAAPCSMRLLERIAYAFRKWL